MSLSFMIRASSVRGSLFAAVSMIALSGCVAAVNEQFDTATVAKQGNVVADATNAGAVGTANAEQASQSTKNEEAPQAAAQSAQNVPVQETGNQMAGLTTQPTGISATQNSIFSNGAQNQAQGAAGEGKVPAPAFVPLPSANPAVKSLYQQDLASQAAALDAQNSKLHPVVNPPAAAAQTVAAPAQPATTAQVAPKTPKNAQNSPANNGSVTLAAFFAAAAKRRSPGGLNSSNNAVESIGASAPNPIGIAFAGRSSMGETFDDEHEEETPAPAGLMKLASLSSLSRVAPNGLHLQTPSVNVSCMKPELIRRIKAIEAHYKRPVVVTSGYRPRVNNVRRGSLHHTCEAADVQVSGVSKWELAKYLRAQPDRGGVGTYCHTESVHLDLGEARDWNWRCRAPKKG